MKRLFVLFVAVLAMGCSGDDDNGPTLESRLLGKWKEIARTSDGLPQEVGCGDEVEFISSEGTRALYYYMIWDDGAGCEVQFAGNTQWQIVDSNTYKYLSGSEWVTVDVSFSEYTDRMVETWTDGPIVGTTTYTRVSD